MRLSTSACGLAVMLTCACATAAPVGSARPVPALQRSSTPPDALATENQLVREIIAESFPKLHGLDIRLKSLRSRSDYFRTSFSATRFFAGKKMRYYVQVNPEWRTQGAPVDGIRSILAHELAHIEDLSRGKRSRLFRLTGLLFKGWTARFERRADLTAIARGYGPGLKVYRSWLYDHVPADALEEKQRDYFAPDEIDAVLAATQSRPDLFDYWRRHVPMTLADIRTVR